MEKGKHPLHNTTAGIALFIGMKTTQFEGGNEYLNFDTKDLGSVTPNISYVNRGERFEHYLYTDVPEKTSPTHIIPILTEIS